ncbi:Holliday junction resolvase RecU [Lederbergia citrisecunda]|uniref:Holliday junction resolvase RecU n=1 Tax=Lederbergia citrisecunda TaxID=2833583 RepID=UPI003D2AD151
MKKTYSRSHANRGAVLERLIDMTNNQYRNKGVADIRKVPTPVQITGNKAGKVTGYTQKGEWVDYVGIIESRTIVFDAKETSERTNFPLKNISEHQYELLKSWHQKGGRKSIPHSTFLMECDRVKSDKGYVLHYLKHVG